MERRPDPTIPAILWLCAAAVVHSLSYQGASTLADVGIGKSELRAFAAAVRHEFHPQDNPMEVSFVGPDDPEAKPEDPKPDDPPVDPKKPEAKKPEAKKPDEKKPDEKKPEEKKITLKLPELKPEPKKPDEKKPEPPKPDEPKPPPEADRRVAVRQHVDKNQPDNPSAQFIADDANKVKEQTRATITAHGQDSSKPTLGPSEGASKDVGNADHSRVADADDHPGDDRTPPGEKASQTSPLQKAPPATQVRPSEAKPNDSPAPRSGDNGRPGPRVAPAPPAPAPPAPTAPADKPAPSPDTKNDPKGSYVINPFQGGSDDARPGSTASAVASAGPVPTTKPYVMPGLGGAPGPKGISFNLSPGAAIAAIGVETIRRDRELDGQRRKTAHRGSFKTQSFEKWRPAIENYVASVKPGTQTALNTAAVPFASYLQTMHERIHPMFADEFLDSLSGLPPDHQLNRQLKTSLEIILDGQTGAIVKMGITRTSGVTAFDVGALSSTERAAGKGFGKAPTAIVSPDGNVYLHWEYHRNPDVACSNKNARPYLLKSAPGGATAPLPGPRVPEVPREGATPATPTR